MVVVVKAFSVGSHCLFLGWSILALAARTVGRNIVIEQRSQELLYSVLATKFSPSLVADPSALILSVPALDLLVLASQNFLFENFCAFAFVDSCDLQDLGSIEPAIATAAHASDALDFHLVDMYSGVDGLRKHELVKRNHNTRQGSSPPTVYI